MNAGESNSIVFNSPIAFDDVADEDIVAKTRTNLGGTTVGNAVFTATNAASAATAIGLGTANTASFDALVIGATSGDPLNVDFYQMESPTFNFLFNWEERRLTQGANNIFTWSSTNAAFPVPVSFSTNVSIAGSLSVGSFTTTTPSTWALDATQTAAATNGRLTLPSNGNVIRLTNNNAISSVTNGVLGAFYYLVNQATNAVTISNVGGIVIDGAQNLTLSPNESATLVATGATNVSVANRGDLTDVALGGTANTAPSQTASSGSSLMTRDLTDTRMVDYIMQQPGRFRNLSHAIQSYTSGTGAAVHAGPIVDGRVNTRIVNGSTNTFAGIRVNRLGPWNGTEGNLSIEWARPINVVVTGAKSIATNNVTRAFLVLGGGTADFDVPTNGNFVALNWTNSTNAQVIVGRAGVLTTNATTISTSATNGQFGVWIDHSTNGTGQIFYAERSFGSNLQKPASPSVSYTNGPAVNSDLGQTSLNFGIIGLSTNTGGGFEIIGLNNAIMFAP
jgi:hypothetical protein